MTTTGNEPDGDYSYDMVHDDMSTPDESAPRTATGETSSSEEAQPSDLDGDYSYDLAHDVPHSRPDSASL